MKNHFLKSVLTAGLLAFTLAASAEDIDLFVGATPSAAAELPNVMIVLDNAANFSSDAAAGSTCIIDGVATALSGKVGGIEQCALYQAVSGLATSSGAVVNIGMMVYNANNIRDVTNANCGGTVGGCLVQPLIPLTAANKAAFLAWIKSWKITGGAGDGYIKANSEATGAAMQETWAYYAGRTGLSGRSYASIKPAAGCQKNYIVFVGNSYSSSGTPGDSTGNTGPKNALEGTNSTAGMNANPAATTLQKAIITSTLNTSCGPNTFPSSAHENKGFYADEWARYLSSQSITTYTIGVLGSSCQAEYAALLTSMAAYGNGKYFPTTNFDGLVIAFQTILSEIQSVNSVYAAVSLPVSVNTQGTYLNQVYIGMFRPDASSLPRWAGNLKQYKLGLIDNELQLLDAEDRSAINNNTGFITECARSFWTPTTADSYWANMNWPSGMTTCIPPAGSASDVYLNSNFPDGNIVEKGAQAYKLRSTTTRTVKTCSSTFASCASLTDFNTANTAITQAVLDPAVGATNRIDLIDWERGLDIADENINAATTTEMRRSAHGDVVHSRPVAINFGTDLAPQVVVFYGGNDGVLRAINGNRDGGLSIGSAAPGSELWAFVAPEFYPKIKRLRDNSPAVAYPGSIVTGALPKSYGFDGPITAYKDSSHTWIYATMRRGGRVLYAFDVTTPASPTLKWKKGCPNADNDTDCTTGFSGIGQTWSSPKALKSSGYGSGASPMLIMGGGYDACEDTDDGTVNHNCTSSTKGNHVYVLDADTGVRLTTLDTERGVVGDISIVPDSSGLAQYAYAADLGGNVYRISGIDANSPIGSTAPASWTITKIASLGCATLAACPANRKFMFGPSVVADDNGVYRLLLGSGDREKPLQGSGAAYGIANYFFMLKDSPTDSSWLSSESPSPTGNGNCSASVICMNSLFGITTSANPTQAQLDGKPKGWYLALVAHEQVVTSAITLYGVVSFSTHQPAVPVTGSCSSNLGTANSYDIAYANAASANGTAQRYEHITGDGLSPSPVGGMVTLDNGQTVPFLIKGIKPKKPPMPPGSTPSQPKSRAYWYIQQ